MVKANAHVQPFINAIGLLCRLKTAVGPMQSLPAVNIRLAVVGIRKVITGQPPIVPLRCRSRRYIKSLPGFALGFRPSVTSVPSEIGHTCRQSDGVGTDVISLLSRLKQQSFRLTTFTTAKDFQQRATAANTTLCEQFISRGVMSPSAGVARIRIFVSPTDETRYISPNPTCCLYYCSDAAAEPAHSRQHCFAA